MRKGAKLAIVLALVAAGGALAYAGAAPEGYLGAAAIAADPRAFEGREVELKASVVEGSLRRAVCDTARSSADACGRDALPVTFLLDDGQATLPVRWDPATPLPDHEAGGTIEGKNVVVHGVVRVDEAGAPYLAAHEMQVGCASKYRAADADASAQNS